METKNSKVIRGFISEEEKTAIIEFVDSIIDTATPELSNKHISHVADNLNGKSRMFDVSKTPVTNYISSFQSNGNLCTQELPKVFYDTLDKIATSLRISKEHVFLQIIEMQDGGIVSPHYDSTVDGYINFKCNISVQSDEYTIHVEDTVITVSDRDLYTFEASLYKHWTSKVNSRRILLSYGFMLKYEELSRSENEPRVRLSKRIKKYFQ